MFDQTFVQSSGTTHKPWALGLSFLLQLIGVGGMVLASLFFADVLPQARLSSYLIAPLPPVSRAEVRQTPARSSPSPRRMNPFVAPVAIPREVAVIDDADLPISNAIPGSIPVGIASSGLLDFPATLPKPAMEAKPKPTAPPPPSKPVPIGGAVQAANLVRKVMPVYPPIARQSRISGKVRFTAIIGTDGTIQKLQLLEGHPFLVKAVQDAIQQWLYRPTLLNGYPVEVITQIEVTFTLGQ